MLLSQWRPAAKAAVGLLHTGITLFLYCLCYGVADCMLVEDTGKSVKMLSVKAAK